MRPTFREDRATQLASRFLDLAGGSLNVLPLVKFIYLVDRTHLTRFGVPVTMDTFYNMPNGPVVSSTMDCINAETEDEAPIWLRHISKRDGYTIRLMKPADPTELSPVIDAMVVELYEAHKHMTLGQWIELAHRWGEWVDPRPQNAKRLPLEYADVLRAAGWSEADIADALDDLSALSKADRVLA